MNDNKVGKFIAKKRKEKGFTQQELGDKLYVTDKAVSKWERGISFPDITLLKKLATILDVEVDDIAKLLNKEPGGYLKTIFEDLENQILYRRLPNVNDKILSYIKNKYKDKDF